MEYYEFMLILHPEMEKEERDEILRELSDLIGKHAGTVGTILDWRKRKLAYEINKLLEGYYYLLYFYGPGTIIPEIEHYSRVTDAVIRYMVVRTGEEEYLRAEKAAGEAAAAEEAVAEEAAAEEAVAEEAVAEEAVAEEAAAEEAAEGTGEPEETAAVEEAAAAAEAGPAEESGTVEESETPEEEKTGKEKTESQNSEEVVPEPEKPEEQADEEESGE